MIAGYKESSTGKDWCSIKYMGTLPRVLYSICCLRIVPNNQRPKYRASFHFDNRQPIYLHMHILCFVIPPYLVISAPPGKFQGLSPVP
ncbi:hypothetical protein V1521DRAFT_455753, partial [Lipomyces starkeyi]